MSKHSKIIDPTVKMEVVSLKKFAKKHLDLKLLPTGEGLFVFIDRSTKKQVGVFSSGIEEAWYQLLAVKSGMDLAKSRLLVK